MANERYELFDLIKETFIRLGEADFEDWWHRQTPELFDAITQAITDPAFKLRPAQRMPEGRWRTWMIRTGRGWGKTQAGSTAVHDCAVDLYPGGNGILVGATVKDVRDTMIEGDSGLLATARPGHPSSNGGWWACARSIGSCQRRIASSPSRKSAGAWPVSGWLTRSTASRARADSLAPRIVTAGLPRLHHR